MIQKTGKRLIRKFIGRFVIPKVHFSYSQFGEDMIMEHFFYQRDIRTPSYLDIGANEPKYISNTYFFYERGSKGVLIEPNPVLFRKLEKQRPNDKVLNVGVGLNDSDHADFYMFPDFANGLSTFSATEAMHWRDIGMKGVGKINWEKILRIPLIRVNAVIEKYFSGRAPDFISLDVEGLDLEILQSMDFVKYRPMLICVETMKYDNLQKGYKDASIATFMESVNYSMYADTAVNTIFLNNEIR